MNFVNRMLELIYLTKSEGDLLCYLLKFRGVWFGFPLKLKEYKFNKSAFVLKVCPLIFENINKL